MRILFITFLLCSLVNAGLLSNKLVKGALSKIGVKIISPGDLKKTGGAMGKKGGLANFGFEQPMARPGGEASALVDEVKVKVLDEVMRIFTILLDIGLYGPYGLPFPMPMIVPFDVLIKTLPPKPLLTIKEVYDKIEKFRQQFTQQQYAKLAGQAMQGLVVARNMNLRHRVDLGTWKETNP